METNEKEQNYFGRGAEALDLQILSADGSIIYDSNGKEYIDFLGGSGVSDLGWGKEEIETAIRDGKRPSYVYPHFHYKPWMDLAGLLEKITPRNLTTSFRTTGGSEAVEAAMEMAMMYTGRKKFLSVEGSYHGNTIGALSIGASANRKKFPNLLSGCEKIELPLDQNTLQQIEEILQKKETAAFFMEPIICNLGVIVPEEGFMKNLNSLCKSTGSLLVMDEAITGFGRTGKFFASEHFEIEPDIMCLAKAFSGGHAGIGAVIATEEVAKAVEGKIGLYSSYGWHPISVDAAIANIGFLRENKNQIFDHITEISDLLKNELSKMKFQKQPEIRIKGLAVGIDVKDKEYASEIKKRSLEKGLLMNTEGSNLLFFPALNIDKEIVLKGLKILEEALQ